MEILDVCTQAIAVASYVSGIQTGFDHETVPEQLNAEDLPAVIAIVGPMAERQTLMPGGQMNEMLETQDFLLRVYALPITQGYDVGEASALAAGFIGPMLNAFDARPHLVNASGLAEDDDDFDFATAELLRALIVSHSGIVVRAYGTINYFAVDFTLRCSGQRETTKVAGN